MAHTDRIIVLIDADCFYCQVEEKLDPSLEGKPMAVVQFNAWRDGGIIAVNYAARDKGCTKGMWMNEAKQNCPEIKFARVTNVRGRADLTKYRDASKKVADVVQTFTQNFERASIDESYIDVTDLVNKRLKNCYEVIKIEQMPDTHVVGSETEHFLVNLNEFNEFTEDNCKLAIGGLIAQEMRAAILERTGYKCSAGIAHNKILAKLACGFHKPNQQTILPSDAVPGLFQTLPLKKIKRLGGKFGASIAETFKITNVGDLLRFSEKELLKKFDEKTSKWLYNIARGVDLEPVTTRIVSKSISCCKRFPLKNVLKSIGSVEHWLNELAIEVIDRLEQELQENNRRAKQVTVSYAQEIGNKTVSGSKTFPISCYKQNTIFRNAFDIVKRNLVIKSDGSLIVNYLGLNASSFQENKKNTIVDLLKNVGKTQEQCRKPLNDVSTEPLDNVQVKIGFYESSDSSGDETSQKGRKKLEFSENIAQDNVSHNLENKIILKSSNSCSSRSCVSKVELDGCNSCISIPNFDNSCISNGGSYVDGGNSCTRNPDNDNLYKINNSSIDSSCVGNSDLGNDSAVNLSGNSLTIHRSCGNSYTYEKNGGNTDGNGKSVTDSGNLYPYASNLVNEVGNSCIKIANSCTNDSNTSSLKEQYARSFFVNYFSNLTSKKEEIETRNRLLEEMRKTLSVISPEEDDADDLALVQRNECTCAECGEVVSVCDQVSHEDYHFARKLEIKETKIDKAVEKKELELSPKNKVKSSRAKIKKKSLERQNQQITSYLGKIQDLDDSNSELCGECRKRVRFEEFDNHSDYHVAKRLHVELNSDFKNQEAASRKRGNKNGLKTSRDITSFFKKT